MEHFSPATNFGTHPLLFDVLLGIHTLSAFLGLHFHTIVMIAEERLDAHSQQYVFLDFLQDGLHATIIITLLGLGLLDLPLAS